MRYISTGIFEHQIKMSLWKSDRLFDTKETIEQAYEQITLDNVFSLFEITLILLAICLIIFLFEMIFDHGRNKFIHKNQKEENIRFLLGIH